MSKNFFGYIGTTLYVKIDLNKIKTKDLETSKEVLDEIKEMFI